MDVRSPTHSKISKYPTLPFKQDFVDSQYFYQYTITFLGGKDLAHLSATCSYFNFLIKSDWEALYYQRYICDKTFALLVQEYRFIKKLTSQVNDYFWDLFCLEPFGIIHTNASIQAMSVEINDNARVIDRAASYLRARRVALEMSEPNFIYSFFFSKYKSKKKSEEEKIQTVQTLLLQIKVRSTQTNYQLSIYNRYQQKLGLLNNSVANQEHAIKPEVYERTKLFLGT